MIKKEALLNSTDVPSKLNGHEIHEKVGTEVGISNLNGSSSEEHQTSNGLSNGNSNNASESGSITIYSRLRRSGFKFDSDARTTWIQNDRVVI